MWRDISRVPTRYLYVVHLFSGVKRQGGIHECINALIPPSGCSYMPISLDVVLDPVRGNLMDRANQDFWLLQAKCGRLHAVVSGPPCETWSVSRWRYYVEATGPRPLRLPGAEWGLATLKLRELRQILTGNALLHLALLMAAAQLLAGNITITEHPSEAAPKPEGQPPSIWKLPVMKIMLAHNHMGLYHLYQGLYGAVSPKPTTLLIGCHPSMRTQFEQCLDKARTTTIMPKPLVMGKTHSGYATAPLKRYPVGLCRAIADGICRGCDHYVDNTSDVDEISDIAHACQYAYECTHESTHDGHDFFRTE